MIVCSLCHRCYETEVVSCSEAGHPPLSETRCGSPEMIAGYRLDYLLESVINGEIYRAVQTASGRSCRIRIVAADEKSSQQFLDEAKLAAALFHPNLVDVYEAGSLESGEVFVVAEDPDGKSLRELLKTVGVPHLLTSIQVVRQTAEALHVLHLKGLTHRAADPENIILTTDAEHRLLVRIKDLDFGGVTQQSIVSNKFFIDSGINSLKYFAPEQCSGEAVGVKADVYSLGIVLYEMLAGVPPFDETTAAALIEKHKNQRPPEIRIDNFDLRMLLTHTLMESLQKRPGSRQSSANAFARQMRHIEQLATHVSTPPPAGVVPSAPPRSAAVVTVAAVAPTQSFIIQPAAVIETYKENTRPVTAAIENEPVSIFKVESEAIAVIDPRSSANDLIAIPDLLSAEPAIEDFVPVIEHFAKERGAPPASRLSRLRIRMKKFHPTTATPLSIQIQALPAEIAAHQAEPENTAVVSHRGKPARIEWNQPEDDIPSVADVLEVLSKEHMTEVPVVQAEPETIAVVSARGTPAMIEWDQPEDHIANFLEEQMTEIQIVQAEPEEITVVTARSKPIRIEWEQHRATPDRLRVQRPSAHKPAEVSFFPTILGEAGKRRTIDLDQRDSMFSAYYPASRARFSVPYRSVMVGGGIAALAVLFLFGDELVRTYSSAVEPGGSAAKTITKQGSVPPLQRTDGVTPAKRKPLSNFRKTMTENVGAGEDRSTPVKERSPLSAETSRTPAVKAGVPTRLPKTRTASRNAKKMPGNGKIKLKTAQEKNSADKKPFFSSPNKTGNSTRPRIVKVPEP